MNNLTKVREEKELLDYFKTLCREAMRSGQYGALNEASMLNLMLTAKDLGISPMKALNGGFYVLNGKICMSTAMMADRIRKEGHSIKILEWTDEKCVIIGKRRDNEDSIKFEFTMQDAARAGLVNSPTWKKYPKQMLYNRAMATLARTLFPDVVGNAYSEDEKYDITNTPPKDRPDEAPDVIEVGNVSALEAVEIPETDEPLSALKGFVSAAGKDVSRLEEFITQRAALKEKPVEQIIESALLLKDSFVEHYCHWLKS